MPEDDDEREALANPDWMSFTASDGRRHEFRRGSLGYEILSSLAATTHRQEPVERVEDER